MSKILTLQDLKDMQPNIIFAKGESVNRPEGLNMSNSGIELFRRNKCFCGHHRIHHTKYINGTNIKGSRYVCTKDNCHYWNLCDLY